MPAQLGQMLPDDRWKSFVLIPAIPVKRGPQPGPVEPIDARARFTIQPQMDWATNPTTALAFDGRLVGKTGSAARLASGGMVIGSGGLNLISPPNVDALPGLNLKQGLPGAPLTP